MIGDWRWCRIRVGANSLEYPLNGTIGLNTIQQWWGNTVFTRTGDWNSVSLKTVAPGQTFGYVLALLFFLLFFNPRSPPLPPFFVSLHPLLLRCSARQEFAYPDVTRNTITSFILPGFAVRRISARDSLLPSVMPIRLLFPYLHYNVQRPTRSGTILFDSTYCRFSN